MYHIKSHRGSPHLGIQVDRGGNNIKNMLNGVFEGTGKAQIWGCHTHCRNHDCDREYILFNRVSPKRGFLILFDANMYRLSKNVELLENVRPNVHLRNRNKIRFCSHKRTYEKYLKSPMSRGITMWDRITEAVQRSTTKVKFKKGINSILTDPYCDKDV